MNGDHPHLSYSRPSGRRFIKKNLKLAPADTRMDLQYPDKALLVIHFFKGDSGNIWDQIVAIDQVLHAFLQTRVKCAMIYSG